MCRYMGNFQIPAASFGVFGVLMLLIWIPIYDLLIMRWLKKVTGNERGITPLQRVGIGLFIAILAMIAAALAEVKRRNAAHLHGLLDKPDLVIPISAFWLVPQHCLFGLAEAFVMVGELEFFYDQSPESMRSTGTALFWSTFAIGNYVSTFLVTLVSKKTDWLENNLNRAHLDYLYWFLAVLSALNLVLFLLSANWFRYKNDGLETDLEMSPNSELALKIFT
jgi:peptide/histidine transporter 3/4